MKLSLMSKRLLNEIVIDVKGQSKKILLGQAKNVKGQANHHQFEGEVK